MAQKQGQLPSSGFYVQRCLCSSSRAGVECEFSKSGWVASWTRSRLDPETISEAMMYKSYLARQEKPIEGLEDDVKISEADVSE